MHPAGLARWPGKTNIDPVAAYDAAERAALSRLGNRAIEASMPAGFHHTDYPTRVHDRAELWRYADTMHDRRARRIFDALDGLTEREFHLWSRATAHAAAVTRSLSRKLVPINAPLAAVTSYRMVAAHYPTGTVFEIGPGSGYVSYMLVEDGFLCRSTEITQAFHLWQNELLGNLMPWWEWIDHKRPDFPVDVIVVNHALCEMREAALRYLIVRAERMLGTNGAILADTLGAPYLRKPEQMMQLFQSRGWKIFCGEDGRSFAFVPPHAVLPERKSVAEKTRNWNDLAVVWKSLGAELNPDDEFADFLEGR